jgi:hypothetical protein
LSNINHALILLGEYVVKFHLAESRVEALEAELETAKQTIAEQGVRLASAYDTMSSISEGGLDDREVAPS